MGVEGEYAPVCIDTKQDQALYALLSQRPETKQHAMIGMSACCIAISLCRYRFAEPQWLVDFVADPLGVDAFSVVGKASPCTASAGRSFAISAYLRYVVLRQGTSASKKEDSTYRAVTYLISEVEKSPPGRQMTTGGS